MVTVGTFLTVFLTVVEMAFEQSILAFRPVLRPTFDIITLGGALNSVFRVSPI